jgi:hypothetical protein
MSAQVLGIDDFAFCQGSMYGTIVVDGERRHVIDLLPERSQIRCALWLHRYPEVQLISRDRRGDYAAAASFGALHAEQRGGVLAGIVPHLGFNSLAAKADITGFIATRSVTRDALHTAIQLVGELRRLGLRIGCLCLDILDSFGGMPDQSGVGVAGKLGGQLGVCSGDLTQQCSVGGGNARVNVVHRVGYFHLSGSNFPHRCVGIDSGERDKRLVDVRNAIA